MIKAALCLYNPYFNFSLLSYGVTSRKVHKDFGDHLCTSHHRRAVCVEARFRKIKHATWCRNFSTQRVHSDESFYYLLYGYILYLLWCPLSFSPGPLSKFVVWSFACVHWKETDVITVVSTSEWVLKSRTLKTLDTSRDFDTHPSFC